MDQQLQIIRCVMPGHWLPREEAADGCEALELIRRRRPDVLRCDIFMPGMDGLRVMAEKRKILTDIPFIMITGYDREYFYEPVMER